MLETPHVALGIALATKIPNPLISIPLSFASHFLLDITPHWNPHFYTETKAYGKPSKFSTKFAIFDELIAIGTTLFFAWYYLPDYKKSLLVMFCALASVISDQIKLPYFFLNIRSGFIKNWTEWERKIQIEVGPFWGILTQIIVICASLFWMLA